jgi:Ca-activated chloride channel family protein
MRATLVPLAIVSMLASLACESAKVDAPSKPSVPAPSEPFEPAPSEPEQDRVWDELTAPTSPHHYVFDMQCLRASSRYGGGPSLGVNLDRGYGHHPTPIDQHDFNFVASADQPRTSFAVRADVAAYSHVRRFLLELARLPPHAAVRSEELLNAFDYEYRRPTGDAALAITTEFGPCPWAPAHRLVHVGLASKALERAARAPRGLVLLVDNSGSLHCNHRLGLIKQGIASLARQLGPADRLAIVGYGASEQGVVLLPTSGADRMTIFAALDRLEQGSADASDNPLATALQLAEQLEGDARVVLLTDGYLHFGSEDAQPSIDAIAAARAAGVELTLLGIDPPPERAQWLDSFAKSAKVAHTDVAADTFATQRAVWAQAGLELAPLAEQVELHVQFDPAQVVEYRLVGYESVRDDDEVAPPHETGTLAAGHAMRAVYELVLAEPPGTGPLMTIELSHVVPGTTTRVSTQAQVDARDISLAATSSDYRFATAVVMFAESLRAAKSDVRPTYAEVLSLAAAALGSDPTCARHGLLELIWTAGTLAGETIEKPDLACTPAPAG